MREHLKQQHNERLAHNGIRKIIEEGIEFYDELYQQLYKQYLTKTDATISLMYKDASTVQPQQRSQHKTEFIAKVTAQKLLICLGDLWRYKIKDTQGQDYSRAEKYYQQAQAWVPSNGVPYNQLAIIAILNVSHIFYELFVSFIKTLITCALFFFSVKNSVPYIIICVA